MIRPYYVRAVCIQLLAFNGKLFLKTNQFVQCVTPVSFVGYICFKIHLLTSGNFIESKCALILPHEGSYSTTIGAHFLLRKILDPPLQILPLFELYDGFSIVFDASGPVMWFIAAAIFSNWYLQRLKYWNRNIMKENTQRVLELISLS